jgi:two-component system LytT family response regulator
VITCIIIDDEQQCVDTLVAMLTVKFSAQISILATTTDSRKATALIAQHAPQLVFMDVEMPHINGIQLMHSFVERTFAVIFTTAYDKYALQAIKTEAVDYLLKPISIDELGEAIQKSALRLPQTKSINNKKVDSINQKLLLPTHNKILAANISDVIRVESDSNYCAFHIINKPKTVVAKPLKEYENILAPFNFFRVHQSHLINLHFVDYFHPGLEEFVVLTNGDQIEVSRRRKAEFLQRLAAL